MRPETATSARWTALRERAEALLKQRPAKDAPSADLDRLIHELETYQIELELQNEQLREAEEQLTESRNRYADLYDFAPVGYLSLTETGEIVEANITAATLLGVGRAALPGRPLHGLVAAEHQDALHLLLRRLRQDGHSDPCELLRAASGEEPLWMELRFTASPHKGGAPRHYRCSLMDVTARRHSELAIRRASRMEAVATLSAGLAHDFNNLMVPVLTNASLLCEDLPTDSPSRQMLEEVKVAARRAGTLARAMVTFSRGAHHDPQPLDFCQLVDETLGLHRGLLGAGVKLDSACDADLCFVRGDRTQLQQVVMNLFINASEAMDGPGKIRVAASNADVDDDAPPAASGLAPGRYVRLDVEDTGRGMDDETREKVFEPFFTTKFQGRGLGLAAVYGIVRQHQGAIALESAPGVGTTCTVWLPTTEEAPPRSGPVDDAVYAGSETVLIIDDERPVARAADRTLTRLGYRTLQAHSGAAALERLRNEEGPIHLVLLDLTMPEMSGAELFPLLREARPDMRILICTGHQRNETIQSLLDSGAVGLVPKPFDIRELGRQVRQALDGPPVTR